MSATTYDLAVIGGGLIGLSVALEARQRGMHVCLLEAETCGRHASSASAGGVRSLNRHPAEISMVRAALPLWDTLDTKLEAPCGFSASGQVRVAEDEAALAALEQRATLTHSMGFDHEQMISADQLRQRVPDMARHCLGALVVEDDGFADPLATTHAYRRKALASGVEIREGVRVEAIEWGGGPLRLHAGGTNVAARSGLNAAGAWGGALAAGVGEPVPLTEAALQMIVTAPLAPFVKPVIGTEGRKLSLKQTSAGAVIIGGGFRGRIACDMIGRHHGFTNSPSVAQSLANAAHLFPHLAEARIVRSWVGIEGMVEDDLPVIGASEKVPGLVHAFGFSGHGFALVPLIGPLIADLIEGGTLAFPLEAFSIGRFRQIGQLANEEAEHTAVETTRHA